MVINNLGTLATIAKIKQTWTGLTDAEIGYYMNGSRASFLKIMEAKYGFTREQAENALSSIERVDVF